MKKIIFIVPYPTGVAPSQRFRFEQYFELLKTQNYEYEISSFWSEKAWHVLYRKGHIITKLQGFLAGVINRFILLLRIHRYQLIFLHREILPLGPPIIEYVISKLLKKKIIYDFDDAIWLPNASEQNSIVGRLKYHRKVQMICEWSWKISCGNEFLADFARKYNSNVSLNPTTIDVIYHKSKHDINSEKKLTIGWTGTHSTTKYLNFITPILKELKEIYEIDIMIISNQRPNWELDDYEFVEWCKAEEIEQLDRIDIGIMPLADTLWENGKCGFKVLQYMSMTKPTVASKVGVNKNIVDHEINGFLCQNIKDWRKCLIKLISSESLRKTMGEEGRKKVIGNYSVQSNSKLFLSFFE